jgi:signal transduction histidine kinase
MFQGKKKTLTQVLQVLVAIGLLPLSLVGAGGIWFSVLSQRDELKRSTLEISRALASAIEAQLDAEAAAVAAIGRSPSLSERDYAAFYAYAKAEVNVRPGWSGMVLTGRDGRVIFRTSKPFGEPDVQVVDPDSLALSAASGRVVVGALTKGPGGRFAFPVRVPVVADGRMTHVLTAVVSPDWALELLRKQNVPQEWVISVFDRNLRRVARSKDHEATVGGLPTPDLAKLFRAETAERAVGVSRNLEGQETFTGFARIKPHGWIVAVGAPTAIAKDALMHGLVLYAIGIMLSALACVLLARRLALRIAREVHSARDSAILLGEGRAVAPARSDIAELDEMAEALGSASVRLTASNAALQHALTAAQEASRTKDEFLAVLGHELRNPLAPMLTALHLMEKKGALSTTKERDILKRQVNHMRRLVDDLLDVSRIVSGKLDIELHPVNLCELAERAVDSFPLSDDRAKISITLPAAPVWVQGDGVRLAQVLTNLLSNALRYGNGSPVALEVEPVAARVKLRIRDEGSGMSPETLAQAFEPFYQAPQQIDRKIGGLGLGLAIVKTIVERHGGKVTALSEGPGKGSVFEVDLPSCEAPTAHEKTEFMRRVAVGVRVLVVDDNEDALNALVQALTMAGHTVRAALTPEDALAAAGTFRPQIAVLDIGLPGMSGHELAERLRRSAPHPLKLIALTGYGQSSDKARATSAGFDVHLAKPVEAATLLDEVSRLVNRP